MSKVTVVSATIPAGQTSSNAVQIQSQGQQVIAMIMPAAWDDAPISFQWSPDGTSFYEIFDRHNEQVTSIFNPNAFVLFPVEPVCPWLRVRSGTKRDGMIPQTADRVFQIVAI